MCRANVNIVVCVAAIYSIIFCVSFAPFSLSHFHNLCPLRLTSFAFLFSWKFHFRLQLEIDLFSSLSVLFIKVFISFFNSTKAKKNEKIETIFETLGAFSFSLYFILDWFLRIKMNERNNKGEEIEKWIERTTRNRSKLMWMYVCVRKSHNEIYFMYFSIAFRAFCRFETLECTLVSAHGRVCFCARVNFNDKDTIKTRCTAVDTTKESERGVFGYCRRQVSIFHLYFPLFVFFNSYWRCHHCPTRSVSRSFESFSLFSFSYYSIFVLFIQVLKHFVL